MNEPEHVDTWAGAYSGPEYSYLHIAAYALCKSVATAPSAAQVHRGWGLNEYDEERLPHLGTLYSRRRGARAALLVLSLHGIHIIGAGCC